MSNLPDELNPCRSLEILLFIRALQIATGVPVPAFRIELDTWPTFYRPRAQS